MNKLTMALCGLGLSLNAWAAGIQISEPYVRATPPGITTSAAFMQLSNSGEQDLALVSASSPLAGKVELHTMKMDGEVMKMRQVEQIEVAAGSAQMLKPGGLHIMLFHLSENLVEGNTIPLSLKFSDGSEQQVEAPIKKVQAMMKHHH